MKIKKTKKHTGARGQTNHGHGARKKAKKSGHKGGVGMAGTGKRADQKKSLVLKKYGNKYFGRRGITSRPTAKKKNLVINVGDISRDYVGLEKRFGKDGVLEMVGYKVLGNGEISRKVKIKVDEVSDGAREKIEKAGGSVEVLNEKEKSEVESVSEVEESNEADE
jgi:large subunit ribosomal protein L15